MERRAAASSYEEVKFGVSKPRGAGVRLPPEWPPCRMGNNRTTAFKLPQRKSELDSKKRGPSIPPTYHGAFLPQPQRGDRRRHFLSNPIVVALLSPLLPAARWLHKYGKFGRVHPPLFPQSSKCAPSIAHNAACSSVRPFFRLGAAPAAVSNSAVVVTASLASPLHSTARARLFSSPSPLPRFPCPFVRRFARCRRQTWLDHACLFVHVYSSAWAMSYDAEPGYMAQRK